MAAAERPRGMTHVSSFPNVDDALAALQAAAIAAIAAGNKEAAAHFAASHSQLLSALIAEGFAPQAQTAAVRSGVQQSQPPQNPPRKPRAAAAAHPARRWGPDKSKWENSKGRRFRIRSDACKTTSTETVQTGNTSAEQVQVAGTPAESTDTPAPAPQAAP